MMIPKGGMNQRVNNKKVIKTIVDICAEGEVDLIRFSVDDVSHHLYKR